MLKATPKTWIGLLVSAAGAITLFLAAFNVAHNGLLLVRLSACAAAFYSVFFVYDHARGKPKAPSIHVIPILCAGLVVILNPFRAIPLPSIVLRTLDVVFGFWFLLMALFFVSALRIAAKARRKYPGMFG